MLLWQKKNHYNFHQRQFPEDIVKSCNCPISYPSRVSTGIPGYGLRMEMIRKFFPFPLWKRFRKSGIPERFPERFFFRKPEISGTLFRNSGSLRNSGTFRKFPERYGISFRKFSGKIVPEISGTIGTRIKLKPLRLM